MCMFASVLGVFVHTRQTCLLTLWKVNTWLTSRVKMSKNATLQTITDLYAAPCGPELTPHLDTHRCRLTDGQTGHQDWSTGERAHKLEEDLHFTFGQ